MSHSRIILLTSLVTLAFASNSLPSRIALKLTGIDTASFTTIRLISGAMMLWLNEELMVLYPFPLQAERSDIWLPFFQQISFTISFA
jgi:hypothetical protein